MLSPEFAASTDWAYGRTRGCQQLACCDPCGDCDRNIDRGAFDQLTVICPPRTPLAYNHPPSVRR
jgi:hypothetical protein